MLLSETDDPKNHMLFSKKITRSNVKVTVLILALEDVTGNMQELKFNLYEEKDLISLYFTLLP